MTKYLLVIVLYGKVVGRELHYSRVSCAWAVIRLMQKHGIEGGDFVCIPLARRKRVS